MFPWPACSVEIAGQPVKFGQAIECHVLLEEEGKKALSDLSVMVGVFHNFCDEDKTPEETKRKINFFRRLRDYDSPAFYHEYRQLMADDKEKRGDA